MHALIDRCNRLGYIPSPSILFDTIELTRSQWARLMTYGVEPIHWPAILQDGLRRIDQREPTAQELDQLVHSANVESIHWEKSLVIESQTDRFDSNPPLPPSGLMAILSPCENGVDVPIDHTLAVECKETSCQFRAWNDWTGDYGSDSAQWSFACLTDLVNKGVLPDSAIVLVEQIQHHGLQVIFGDAADLVAKIAAISAAIRLKQSQ